MKTSLLHRLANRLFAKVIAEHRAEVYAECAGLVDGYIDDAVAMLEPPRVLNGFRHAADQMKRNAIGERSK